MRGQRFVWHQAAGQPWVREGWRAPGFETQDVGGIAQATQGLGQLTVVRPSASKQRWSSALKRRSAIAQRASSSSTSSVSPSASTIQNASSPSSSSRG